MSAGLAAFTIFHVLISLIAIAAGFVFVWGLLKKQLTPRWTSVFLWGTIATSVTGFMFPFHHFMPSHAVGILSLLVLTVTLVALYVKHLAGAWRWIFVVTAIFAFYLNCFVLVVQMFLKIPALKAIAPTQTEPPFKMAQLAVLAFFVIVGIVAAIRFRPQPQVATATG